MLDKQGREIVVVEIDPFLRGGIMAELVSDEARAGRADLVEDISELDVVLGADIDTIDSAVYGSHLCGTESLLFNLRDDLYRKGFSAIELRDTNAILKFLSGSNGFLQCRDVIKNMQDYELGFIASWLCVYGRLNYDHFDNLKVGIVIKEDTLDIKISEIIDNYKYFHKREQQKTLHEKITIIPNHFWLQQEMQKIKQKE